MIRDIERLKKLLAATKSCRKLMRAEMADGANMAHFHQQLLEQESWLASHIVDSEKCNQQAEASAAAAEQPAA